ncbi:MAG: histidine kinase, partial [Bacteroidota bacterium]
DQAIRFYREALRIAEAQEDNRRAGIRLMNIGALYVMKENYPAAEQHFLRARDYIEQVKAWPIKAKILQNLAELHYRQGHLDEAEKWVKAAIQLNQKISNLESIHKNYLTWHDIESKRGNYPKALEHYQKYATLKDSLLNERNLAKLEELQAKYETEKKEEAIANLSQQNQIQSLQLDQRNLWIALLAIALVLISSLIIILYRQRLLKEKNQALRIKQKLLRTQINPHFFFNVLSNIQSMFLEQTDAQKTTYYLSKFAKLMRSVLENSREEVISLEEEMHMLESYLEIQKLRFGERLCYSIEYDQSLDPRETALPPMLAQPFIENSLEHGILNKEGVGKVEIRFWKEQNQLFFSVIDNGIGRSQATQVGQKKGIVSLATTITRERLEVLNRTWKKALGFKIQDLWDEQENPTGTQVIFNIPLVKL